MAELWYDRGMRSLLFAVSLGFLASGCAVETSTHARIDDTDVTITTFHDAEPDDEADFGLRLGAPESAFSFTLLAAD